MTDKYIYDEPVVAETEAEREKAYTSGFSAGDRKQSIAEAAVIYGDIETAENYGYVERGLVMSCLAVCFDPSDFL